MRKLILGAGLALACAAGVLLGSASHAHTFKDTDLNGGHWDDAGYYHCHLEGCVPTAHRHQFRSRALSSQDMERFYLQEDWPYWQLASGCKTMRTVVLENTSLVPVTWTNPRQCEIREGLWIDEYTGDEYTRAAALEVDHIIPPMYANGSNGYQWDLGKRTRFANDPYNLIPVGRDIHRRKSDRSIGAWQPRKEFMCEYAATWRDLAETYDLDLFSRDQSRINSTLKDCTEQVGPGAID